MKTKITIREVIMFGIMLLLSFFLFVKKDNYSELQKEKTILEEKIKYYQKELNGQAKVSDSLKANVKSLQAVIDYQKQNPKIIIEKYDKVRDNIRMLDADGQIGYLAKRLSAHGGYGR